MRETVITCDGCGGPIDDLGTVYQVNLRIWFPTATQLPPYDVTVEAHTEHLTAAIENAIMNRPRNTT